MAGCLRWVLRLLILVVIGALLALGWVYRDRIQVAVHDLLEGPESEVPAGRPSAAGFESAERKLGQLLSERVDSVVLTSAEVASAAREALRATPLGVPDSLEVRMLDGAAVVSGLVDPDRLPGPIPAGIRRLLRAREKVEAMGRATIPKRGQLEVRLERLTVRGVPIPTELVLRALERSGGPVRSDGAVRFPMDQRVTGILLRPGALVLYGGGSR